MPIQPYYQPDVSLCKKKKRGREMVKCFWSCEEDIKAALQCLPLISAQNIEEEEEEEVL